MGQLFFFSNFKLWLLSHNWIPSSGHLFFKGCFDSIMPMHFLVVVQVLRALHRIWKSPSVALLPGSLYHFSISELAMHYFFWFFWPERQHDFHGSSRSFLHWVHPILRVKLIGNLKIILWPSLFLNVNFLQCLPGFFYNFQSFLESFLEVIIFIYK